MTTTPLPDGVTLPADLRLWQPGDPTGVDTPVLDPVAYHGTIGKYVTAALPGTEAHPAAIAAAILTYVGCYIGRGKATYKDGVHWHEPVLYVAIVGYTSIGGKTTALRAAKPFFQLAFGDSRFDEKNTTRGLASGEALIAAVADTRYKVDKNGNNVIAHQGVDDKRRVVDDPELSQLIKKASPTNSTLGENLIAMYDGDSGEVNTKKTQLKATRPHIAIVSTITPQAFRDSITSTMIANGFANRFMYVYSEITQTGRVTGTADQAALNGAGLAAAASLDAITRGNRILRLDSGAAIALDAEWKWLRYGRGIGAVEAMTVRGAVHALRIATIYAALDNSAKITADHMRAGIAWARYSADTVEWMMEGAGSGLANKLLRALRSSGGLGLSRVEQHELFGRHVSSPDLDEATELLISQRQAWKVAVPSGGAPKQMLFATVPVVGAASKP